MNNTLFEAGLSIIKASASKQYAFLIKVIMFALAIISSTLLIFRYYGEIHFKLDFLITGKTILNPLLLLWLMIFIFFQFALYPTIAKALTVIYRIIYPPSGKFKKHVMKGATRGFHLTGIQLKLENLNLEQLETVYNSASVDLIGDELETVERQSYLLIIFFQFCIFYKTLLLGNMTFLAWFIIGAALLLLYIFLALPQIYKLGRNLLLSEYKRIKNIHIKASQAQER
jgi:hypothetical protein